MRSPGVGNDIAHDLRTPLTRARFALERASAKDATKEELQSVADKAIAGIDQSLTIITALLRLAEIEGSRRSAGFGTVALADLADRYEPFAENKRIAIETDLPDQSGNAFNVHGDRDLLIEAVVNLVDNAVKFTPEGGPGRRSRPEPRGHNRQTAWLHAQDHFGTRLRRGDFLPAGNRLMQIRVG